MEEIQALKTLVQLQRERIIKIMACNKGAGIIILDFEEYLRSCYEHLGSQQMQIDGSLKSYYVKIPEAKIGRAKQNIEYLIQEAQGSEVLITAAIVAGAHETSPPWR